MSITVINPETGVVALGDAILACLTERPMTGYELAKTFDSSIGFFWKADHQQIYRELSKLRDRGHVQAGAVRRQALVEVHRHDHRRGRGRDRLCPTAPD